MTCSNCSSNDIIEIDSQHYCINCGQRVSERKVEPITIQSKSLSSQPTPVLQKSEEDFRKLPVPVNVFSTSKPEQPAMQEVARVKSAGPRTLNLKTPHPSTKPKHTDAIPVKKPSETEVLKPSTHAQPPLPQQQPIPPQTFAYPPRSTPSPQPVSHHPSHNQPIRSMRLEADHPIKSALRVTMHHFWLEIAAYSLGTSLLWFYLQQTLFRNLIFPPTAKTLVNAAVQPLVVALSIGLIAMILLAVARAFIKAKFIYAIVKQIDQRSSSTAFANQVGVNSLWSLISLDIIAASMFTGLLLIEIIAYHFIGLLPDGTGVVQPLALTITNIGLVFLAIGVITARALASRTGALASRRASTAFSECWKLYWHFSGDIVIWGTESALITLVITSPLILLLSITNFASVSALWLGVLIVSATVSSYLSFVFNVGFWTAIYYELCSLVPPSRRNFFVGPKQPKMSNGQLAIGVAAVIATAGLGLSGWLYQTDLSHWLVSVLKR